MKDISFVVFTNEKYFDLLYLTLPYTIENTKHLEKNIYVVSNRVPPHEVFDEVKYIDSNISFRGDETHFRDCLLVALKQIPEEFILFLCDDYLIKSPLKKERFDGLVELLENLNADYLALGTQKHIENFVVNWNKPNIHLPDYNFPDGSFYEFDETARHLYSVQPCIWRRSSLIELLEYNPTVTLHQLDNTDIKNKRGETRNLDSFYNFSFYERKENFFDYGFKSYCYHYPPFTYHVDEKPLSSDFFLIDYIEIVRHGKFLTAEVNSKYILNDILNSEEKRHIKDKLQKFIN